MNEFRPDWVSAPGDTISDVLREKNLSESDLALRLGRDQREIEALLRGSMTITLGLARKLKESIGGSVEFWMSRDFQYRQSLSRANSDAFLSELPVADMIKFGWLQPVREPAEKLGACLNFFGVSNVPAWYETYGNLTSQFAFRTSAAFDSELGALAAWLRRGEIEAAATECKPWSPAGFEANLPAIRDLTRHKDPRRFLPKLRELCAQCGVAVAIVRAPDGCRASGATRLISDQKALLMLSFRHLSDDHFWFSFFHEAGHLIMHGDRTTFLEGNEGGDSPEEVEANNFAAATLIPRESRVAMLRLRLEATELIRFARGVGVSPGIVVGQLQHEGKIKHGHFNSLKRRYTWE